MSKPEAKPTAPPEVIQDDEALAELEAPTVSVDLDTGESTEIEVVAPVVDPPAEEVVAADEEVAPPAAPVTVERIVRDPQLEQRLSQMEAELLKGRVSEVVVKAKEEVTKVEEKIVAVKVKLKKALEDGNTDQQIELTDQLADLKGDWKIGQLRVQQAEQQTTRPQVRQAQEQAPSHHAVKWLEGNKSWFQQPGYENLTAYSLLVDRQVMADGFDMNTPAYYAEVDKRLKKVKDALIAPPAPPKPKTPAPPVAPAGASPTPAPNSKRSITLTSKDFNEMERVGLDPKNKLHLKRYAEAKSESDKSAALANQ